MSVGQQPLENYRYSAGIAYISLVSDLGREEYINQCYKTNTVSLKFEDGSTSHQIPIDISVLNFIEFPLKVDQNGTPVFWVNEPITGKPIIVGRGLQNDKMSGLEEGQFKFTQSTKDGLVEIAGSSLKNYLNLTVTGKEISNINLIVHNEDNQGNINLKVQGDVTIESTDVVSINGNNSLKLKSINDEGSGSEVDVSNDEVSIQTQRFEIGEGREPMMLGLKTIEFIGKFIDTLYRTTVTTQLGLMPLMNREEILKLKEELESLNSIKSFTD